MNSVELGFINEGIPALKHSWENQLNDQIIGFLTSPVNVTPIPDSHWLQKRAVVHTRRKASPSSAANSRYEAIVSASGLLFAQAMSNPRQFWHEVIARHTRQSDHFSK